MFERQKYSSNGKLMYIFVSNEELENDLTNKIENVLKQYGIYGEPITVFETPDGFLVTRIREAVLHCQLDVVSILSLPGFSFYIEEGDFEHKVTIMTSETLARKWIDE